MSIIGFNLKNISVEKKNQITGRININNNLRVTEIKEEKPAFTASDEVIRFEFKFDISYEPEVGHLSIEGYLLYMEDPKKIKQILELWKKEKKLSKEVSEIVFNTILARCNVKALTLAQEVGLPPHFRLPHIKPNN